MISGTLLKVLYWYEGMTAWVELGATPPTVPVSTVIYLNVVWRNTGDDDLAGHVAATVTKPDGSTVELSALSGQDQTTAPGTDRVVMFGAVLDQAGTYTAGLVLSETDGEGLDTLEISFANTAAAGIDISALISMLVVVMMMTMMMTMIKEA